MTIDFRRNLNHLLDEYKLPRIVVELGVAEGRFSEEMFNWGLDGLYLVDIWERMPFIEGCASFDQKWHDDNYKRVCDLFINKPNVIIFKGFSHKVSEQIPDKSVGIVYVDGDHTYQGCKSDISSWWPKLVDGGVMAFHDYGNSDYGVQRAVIEHMKDESLINIISEDNSPANIGAWIRKQSV